MASLKRARSPDGAAGVAAWDPLLQGCRSVHSLQRLGRIDEGTFGVVFKACDTRTGELVAVKQIKIIASQAKDGFPITALRELNVLMVLDHPNILKVREMLVGSSPEKIFMSMDLYDCDLRAVMDQLDSPLSQAEVKRLMHQLVSAVAYMHERWVVHRDLKTSNLLYNVAESKLALADFGLARSYGEPLRAMTVPVVTLWYRSPELLFGETTYGPPVDVWSVGCIFGELLVREPILRGEGELDQLDKTFRLVGGPSEEVWPGFKELPGAKATNWERMPRAGTLTERFSVSPFVTSSANTHLGNAGMDLLRRMLALDPAQRITAAEALQHAFFTDAPAMATAEEMRAISL